MLWVKRQICTHKNNPHAYKIHPLETSFASESPLLLLPLLALVRHRLSAFQSQEIQAQQLNLITLISFEMPRQIHTLPDQRELVVWTLCSFKLIVCVGEHHPSAHFIRGARNITISSERNPKAL
jgi:hypothetical protein